MTNILTTFTFAFVFRSVGGAILKKEVHDNGMCGWNSFQEIPDDDTQPQNRGNQISGMLYYRT